MAVTLVNPRAPVKDLAAFLKYCRDLREKWVAHQERPGEEQGLWLRGQRCATWGLTPQLYRREFLDADEAEIRQEFQARAIQLIQGRIPQTKFDWYFLMRHYRAPTRLLDWTDNPLVALFFAVEHDDTCDAAVWVLDPWWLNRNLAGRIRGPILPDWEEADRYLRDLKRAFETQSEATAKLPAAIDPPHIDRRVAAQGSRFVIFGRSHDLSRIGSVKKKGSRLAKILISGKHRGAVRSELEMCGVSAPALYLDMDTLCKDISRKWTKTLRSSPNGPVA